MGQHLRLLFEGFLLVDLQTCLVELIPLELQVVVLLATLRLGGGQLLQLTFEGAVVAEGVLISHDRGIGGEGVEQVQTERAVGQREGLMLRVNIYNMGTEGLKERQLHRGVVGESAALTRRQNLASQHKLVVVVDIRLIEEGLQSQSSYIELRLDDAFAFLFSQHGAIGPLAEEQSEGAQQDALASACLTRDSHKAVAKADVSLADKGVVFDMESLKHILFRS